MLTGARCAFTKQIAQGIGGVFLRSRDPEALAAWYRENLCIAAYAPSGGDVWRPAAGPTVFATFARPIG